MGSDPSRIFPAPAGPRYTLATASLDRAQGRFLPQYVSGSLRRCHPRVHRPLTRSDICLLTADHFTSKIRRHTSLHPILAADTTLARVDVRFEPSSEAAIPNKTYYAYRHAHATATQASHVRLISKDFPWFIDIKTSGHPVTCDDIWSGLHAALREPLADSEWGILSHDPSRAKKVQKAAKQRQSDGDKDKILKRVDWVKDSFIFRGLERDDDFAKRRLAYVDSECEETWVVELVTP